MINNSSMTGESSAESRVLSTDYGEIRVITLNNPDRRNALDLPMRLDLLKALRLAEAESRVIVLAGVGGFFCSGGDIQAMTDDLVMARTRLDVLGAIATQLANSTVPIVVAVEGGAYGAGLSLACAATYVISAKSAKFEASFGKLGLGPDTGLSWTLPRRIGLAKARQMILLLHRLDATSALDAGLVDEIVSDGQALAKSLQVASQFSQTSGAMAFGVNQLLATEFGSIEAAASAEAALQISLLQSRESIELRRNFQRQTKQHMRLETAYEGVQDATS